MILLARYMTLLAVGMLTANCGQGRSVGSNGSVAASTVDVGVSPTEFTLPTVPDTLTTVEARADYVATRYWDSMDFADNSQGVDTAFVEQNFANFSAILALASADVADAAVGNLVERVAVNPDALSLMAFVAEKYLDEPNSPMRNEEQYILFLRRFIDLPSVGSDAKLRWSDRLEDAMKNRPGTPAADFNFDDRNGHRRSLKSALAANVGGITLLIFYDPDCDLCSEIMSTIAELSLPDSVAVIAIDAETNRARWNETKAKLPALWTVGFATTPILDSELYTLPASPTLYLLESDGTVILKDPSVADAIRAIQAV